MNIIKAFEIAKKVDVNINEDTLCMIYNNHYYFCINSESWIKIDESGNSEYESPLCMAYNAFENVFLSDGKNTPNEDKLNELRNFNDAIKKSIPYKEFIKSMG